jgi:hypothetical protein
MDPFIEDQEWSDFHSAAIQVIRELLVPMVGEHYVVRTERRVYLERYDADDMPRHIEPDVFVASEKGGRVQASAQATIAPVECILPMPAEKRESFLVIRDLPAMEVVTVLELLSPGNKRPGSDGRAEYLAKRAKVLDSPTHLVEIDLLRGGERLPLVTPLPPGEYFVIVSRHERRPKAKIYGWPLRHSLPKIDVPLKLGDGDVLLELQAVLDTVYDRARYDRSLDYTAELLPPPSDADAQWVRERCSAT